MIISFFKEIIDSFNFVIAPPICIICSKTIDLKNWQSDHICTDCFLSLPSPMGSKDILSRIDEHFGANNNPYIYAFSLFDSQGNMNYLELIHCLKYTKFKKIGYFLGSILGERIEQQLLQFDFDIHFIVPVPIHPVRRKERGFNQSEIIGESISKTTGIPLNNSIIMRNEYTISQTKLNLNERIRNVELSFELNCEENKVKDKNFLIVDDIITSGSTLYYCGKLLKENGAKNLVLAVLTTA